MQSSQTKPNVVEILRDHLIRSLNYALTNSTKSTLKPNIAQCFKAPYSAFDRQHHSELENVFASIIRNPTHIKEIYDNVKTPSNTRSFAQEVRGLLKGTAQDQLDASARILSEKIFDGMQRRIFVERYKAFQRDEKIKGNQNEETAADRFKQQEESITLPLDVIAKLKYNLFRKVQEASAPQLTPQSTPKSLLGAAQESKPKLEPEVKQAPEIKPEKKTKTKKDPEPKSIDSSKLLKIATFLKEKNDNNIWQNLSEDFAARNLTPKAFIAALKTLAKQRKHKVTLNQAALDKIMTGEYTPNPNLIKLMQSTLDQYYSFENTSFYSQVLNLRLILSKKRQYELMGAASAELRRQKKTAIKANKIWLWPEGNTINKQFMADVLSGKKEPDRSQRQALMSAVERFDFVNMHEVIVQPWSWDEAYALGHKRQGKDIKLDNFIDAVNKFLEDEGVSIPFSQTASNEIMRVKNRQEKGKRLRSRVHTKLLNVIHQVLDQQKEKPTNQPAEKPVITHAASMVDLGKRGFDKKNFRALCNDALPTDPSELPKTMKTTFSNDAFNKAHYEFSPYQAKLVQGILDQYYVFQPSFKEDQIRAFVEQEHYQPREFNIKVNEALERLRTRINDAGLKYVEFRHTNDGQVTGKSKKFTSDDSYKIFKKGRALHPMIAEAISDVITAYHNGRRAELGEVMRDLPPGDMALGLQQADSQELQASTAMIRKKTKSRQSA